MRLNERNSRSCLENGNRLLVTPWFVSTLSISNQIFHFVTVPPLTSANVDAASNLDVTDIQSSALIRWGRGCWQSRDGRPWQRLGGKRMMRRLTCANVDACMKSWFDWHSNSVSLLLPDVITTNIISIKREVVFWKVFNLCMFKSSSVLCTAKFRTRKCEQYLGYVGYLGYLGYLGYQGSNSSCKNSGLSLSLVKMQAEECSRGGGMWHVTIPNANASTYVSHFQMQMQCTNMSQSQMQMQCTSVSHFQMQIQTQTSPEAKQTHAVFPLLLLLRRAGMVIRNICKPKIKCQKHY